MLIIKGKETVQSTFSNNKKNPILKNVLLKKLFSHFFLTKVQVSKKKNTAIVPVRCWQEPLPCPLFSPS